VKERFGDVEGFLSSIEVSVDGEVTPDGPLVIVKVGKVDTVCVVLRLLDRVEKGGVVSGFENTRGSSFSKDMFVRSEESSNDFRVNRVSVDAQKFRVQLTSLLV
jgi:hypothetical protein